MTNYGSWTRPIYEKLILATNQFFRKPSESPEKLKFWKNIWSPKLRIFYFEKAQLRHRFVIDVVRTRLIDLLD